MPKSEPEARVNVSADVWTAQQFAARAMLAALEPLAMAARKQEEVARIRGRVQEGDTKRETLEAADRWQAMHDAAAVAIAAAKAAGIKAGA